MANSLICKIEGCSKSHHAKGLCKTHYESKRLDRSVSFRAKNKGHTCAKAGCAKPSVARGLCHGHHAELRVGRVHFSGRAKKGALLDWIHANLNHSGDDCLMWPFGRDQKGYGSVKFRGVQTNAHRVVCILAHGNPQKLRNQAAHSCGKGHLGCVNPRHLSWKSAKENCADREKHNSISCREDI